jgi:hypothetical protein
MPQSTFKPADRPPLFIFPVDEPGYSGLGAGVSSPTCTKVPGETRQFVFDFGDYFELREEGQTLTGTPAISSAAAGLSLGSPAVVGDTVVCLIGGGTDATDYRLTVTCGTSDGLSTVAGVGVLQVRAVP